MQLLVTQHHVGEISLLDANRFLPTQVSLRESPMRMTPIPDYHNYMHQKTKERKEL